MPGRHSTLANSSVSRSLARLGLGFSGRDHGPAFESLEFEEKVASIRGDLRDFPDADCLLVGRSYGGYLLLHALVDQLPHPGRVLLLSPVLGSVLVRTEGGVYASRPPRGEKLMRLARSGAFPAPGRLGVVLGDADPVCTVDMAREFTANVPGASLEILPGVGHRLLEDVLDRLLGEWAAPWKDGRKPVGSP